MDNFAELNEISGDLSEANQTSKRKGKWSSVPEVQRYSNEKVTLAKMRQLVKRGNATEKIVNGRKMKLFKQRTAIGWAGFGDSSTPRVGEDRLPAEQGGDDRGEQGYDYPEKPRDEGKKDDDWWHWWDDQPRRDSGRGRTRKTVERGIGIAVLGGMGGGSTARGIPSGANF